MRSFIKKHFISFITLYLFLSGISAQPRGQSTADSPTLSGKVIDENNIPIPYASVALYRPDSSLEAGAATDDKGIFYVNTKAGTYYLVISFLSYETKIIKNISITNKAINLGNISLVSSSIKLDAVEITAERSQMQLQLDKRVFVVGKDLSNTGSNGVEVLDKVPSVSVDIDGNVSLRGSENVRILVDGKPSGLIGTSVANALRQLQGSMIEQIEVITNPSARYDAEGEVGIINIILKKDNRENLNGSFDVSIGYPDNYSGAFNLNYRKKWINLFTTYGISYRKTPGTGYIWQEFSSDTNYAYERIRDHTRGGLGYNARLGSDFYLNKNNTLTVSGLYKNSTGLNDVLITYNDYFDNKLVKKATRTEDEKEEEQNIDIALSYLKTFEQKDRKLTIDAKWNQSDDTETSKLFEQGDNATDINQRSSNTEDETNFLFQSDYIHPFNKNSKIETGVKATMRTIDNNYTVEQQNPSDTWSILSNYDNHFLFNENIYAAYLIASNKSKKKLSYQGGLRVEFSDITTELVQTKEKNNRTYYGLFPSVHLNYELDTAHTLQLSYSRRLSRPRFWFLLPFNGFSDSRNIFSGNPDLEPEYTHSIELGHLTYLRNGSLLSSVYYRYRTGVVERITLVDSIGYTRMFPINLSTQNAYGFELNINYDIKKWWQANGNFNFYKAITDGNYDGDNLHSETYTFSGKISTKITLLKKWDVQVSGDYRAPRKTTQGEYKARYSVDVGFARDVLKGNGTLVFSIKDVFNTRKMRATTYGDDFFIESEFQWHSRQAIISFNYRLNQKKKKSRNRSEDYEGGDMDF